MATLPTLTVNGDGTTVRNWTTQDYFRISEGFPGNDADYIQAPASTNNVDTSFSLTNMPTDFVSMSTLNFNARGYFVNWSDDSLSTWCRIVASDGTTILAAADSSGTFRSMQSASAGTSTPASTTAISFQYVNTNATKAQWDGAEVQFRQVYAQNMGADGAYSRITGFQINGTYKTAPPTAPTNVQVTRTSQTTVDVTWTLGSDDVGVDHQTIETYDSFQDIPLYQSGSISSAVTSTTVTTLPGNLDGTNGLAGPPGYLSVLAWDADSQWVRSVPVLIPEWSSSTPMSGTDSSAITITESSSLVIQAVKTASDSAAISIAEVSSFGTTAVAAADAAALGVTDSTLTVTSSRTTADSTVLSITDSAAVFVTRTASDTSTLSVTDTSSIIANVGKSGSEPVVLSVAEASSFSTVTVVASDTPTIALTESRSLVVPRTASDATTLSVSETSSIVVSGVLTKSASDAAALSITDSSQSVKVIAAASDAAVITVTENVITNVYLTRTDSPTIALSESTAITSSRSASDSAVLSVSETSSAVPVIAPTTLANIYIGGGWVTGQIKVYTNNSWADKPVKVYESSAWRTL